MCLLSAPLACSPGSGALMLEARNGRILDRESGVGIPSADVFQVYWGRGVAGEPRPAYALRWTRSHETGAFDFERAASTEPRSWLLETDAAEYGFYHPDYGLVRSGPAREEVVTLRAPKLDAAGRAAQSFALCETRPADEVSAELARLHCDASPAR